MYIFIIAATLIHAHRKIYIIREITVVSIKHFKILAMNNKLVIIKNHNYHFTSTNK